MPYDDRVEKHGNSLITHLAWQAAERLVEERGYPPDDLFAKFKANELPVLTAAFTLPDPCRYEDIEDLGVVARNDLTIVQFLRTECSVKRALIDEFWPGLPESSVKPARTANRGGRPQIHDWAGLSAYMTAYLAENDYPETNAQAERTVREWFERKYLKCPDDSAVRKWVKALYDSRDEIMAIRPRPCGQRGFPNQQLTDSRLFFAESGVGSRVDVGRRMGVLRAVRGRERSEARSAAA